MSAENKPEPVWCIFLRSLPVGGVERQFTTLVNRLAEKRRVLLVTLFKCSDKAAGLVSERVGMRALFDVEDSGYTPLKLLVRAPGRLRKICGDEQIDVLYSAREVANLVAALAVRKLDGVRLLWGHRSSAHRFSPRIRVLFPFCRLVQSRVHCQIANSADGIAFYKERGLCRGDCVQIPNFVDPEIFQPSPELREEQRREWGLDENTPALGIVGRVAPMKNHEGFLHVASLLSSRLPNARFIVVGPAGGAAGDWLQNRISHHNIEGRVAIFPAQPMNEMARVYNGLDVLCSTSLYGEGFPNVVAEAMACGCPVVATDIGEARTMLGDLSPVVKAGDDLAFRDAVLDILGESDRQIGRKLRARIRGICDSPAILRKILRAGEA